MEGHVDLGANLESFVDRLVQEGGFASRDEVIRESVRLLQEREQAAWLAEFDASIEQGLADIEAGRGRDLDEVVDELCAKYQAMADARVKR